MDVSTKKRAGGGKKRQLPAKKRHAPARPRVSDLHDYSSVGRPTKYVPQFGRVAEAMAAAGATDAEIAQACGVTVRTLYRWKAAIAGFRHIVGAAKQTAIVRVERALYHRAVGYEHEHYKILSTGGRVTIVKTVKHYPPETSAACLWLQNVDPLHWRSRQHPEAAEANRASDRRRRVHRWPDRCDVRAYQIEPPIADLCEASSEEAAPLTP